MIDIDNEEQILRMCDFDYFYNSKECSRELCVFYNDIGHQNSDFNTRQAFIDLGRIGITLNNQANKIKRLKNKANKICIDKLEKIKKHIEELWVWKETDGLDVDFQIYKYIDQEINELKKEKQ